MAFRNKPAIYLLAATTFFSAAARAATVTAAYTFPPANGNGAVAAGALPTEGVTLDPAGSGALFGATTRGGNYSVNGYGGGVVFKLAPPAAGKTAYTETVLHAFTGGTDGIFPGAGNVFVQNGNVYGTTVGNAELGGCGKNDTLSCDTVFELTPPAAGKTAWGYGLLYRFLSVADGYEPEAGLIAGPAGSVYGSTTAGGNQDCTSSYTNGHGTTGCGTVFKLSPPASGTGLWTKTILYKFTGGADGGLPLAALLADPSGSGVLYGTGSTGGSKTCSFGSYNCGVVFALAPPAKGKTAWTETVLYSFKGGSDGLAPTGALVMKGGALYGTTMSGGHSCDIYGCGTVFQLTPPAKGATAWTFKTLYAFKGSTDGGVPMSAVTFGASGALYGTTFQFGSKNTNLLCGSYVGCGTLFQLTPPATGTSWTEKPLYVFTGGATGGESSAGLALDAGVLFGTTALGGSGKCPATIAPTCGGVVFKVTP
jgi:uncharacterized repeat protein (TIGR03803 family)